MIETEQFKKNLQSKASADLKAMQEEMAKALSPIFDRYGFGREVNFTLRFYRHYSSYTYSGNSGYVPSTSFDEKEIKKINEHFERKSIEDFQDALKNFAWAVQNPPNQS